MSGGQGLPDRIGAGRDLPFAFQQPDRRADERTVLAALDVGDFAGPRLFGDLRLVDPAEISAENVTVAQLELETVDFVVLRRAGRRNAFARDNLPEQDRSPSFSVARVSGRGQKNPRPLTRIRPIIPVIISRLIARPVPVNQMAGSPRRISSRTRIRWPCTARAAAGE